MFKMTSYYYLAKLSNSHILSNRILLEWALCQGFSNKLRPWKMDVILKEPMSKRMNKGNEGEKQREKIKVWINEWMNVYGKKPWVSMLEWSNKLINQWKNGWVSLSKKSTNRQLTITTGDYRRPSPVQLAFAFPGSHKLVARFAVIYHNLSISKFWSKAFPVWRQSRISAADNYRNFLQLYFLKMQLESLIYESKTTNS